MGEWQVDLVVPSRGRVMFLGTVRTSVIAAGLNAKRLSTSRIILHHLEFVEYSDQEITGEAKVGKVKKEALQREFVRSGNSVKAW